MSAPRGTIIQHANAEASLPQRFYLWRHADATGTSGTGLVAHGVRFEDGVAVMRWATRYRSTAIYASIRELQAIHGHGGATELIWVDGDEQ